MKTMRTDQTARITFTLRVNAYFHAGRSTHVKVEIISNRRIAKSNPSSDLVARSRLMKYEYTRRRVRVSIIWALVVCGVKFYLKATGYFKFQ